MKAYILYTLLITAFAASGQEPQEKTDNLFWFGYYNSFILKSKFEINSDAQFRTKEGLSKPSQALVRSALTFKPGKYLSFSVGLAHFRYYLDDVTTRGEWRPWQEIALKASARKLKLSNRLRTEQRFNELTKNNLQTGKYSFNWRFRYKFDLQVPVFKLFNRNVSVIAGNEFMYQAFEGGQWKFDQDRIFAGLNYEQNRSLTFQVQFLYILQKQANTTLIDKYSVFRFNIYHTLQK